jgi:hypothetical protein
MEKMGIDWRERWREFEDDLERLRKNPGAVMTWDDADAICVPAPHPAHAAHGGR